MRRSVGAAVAAALALALAGCAGVPHHSAPATARKVPPGVTVSTTGDVTVVPRGPYRGAAQRSIVWGWLRALKSQDGDYRIAREYLTSAQRRRWRPSGEVSILHVDCVTYVPDSELTTETWARLCPDPAGPSQTDLPNDGPVSMRVVGSVVGTVNPRGTFQPADPGRAQISITLTLTRVDQEWRINAEDRSAGAPSDPFILDTDFDLVYQPVDLYFGSYTNSALTPDRRYFAERGDRLPAAIVRELVLGPSPSVARAVRTGFPTHTKVRGVYTEAKGALTVDLTGNGVDDLDSDSADLVGAQLVWTLRQLDVVTIRPLLRGKPIGRIQGGNSLSRTDYATYDPNVTSKAAAYCLTAAGGLQWLLGPQATIPPSPALADIAVAKSGTLVLGLTAPDQSGAQYVRTVLPASQLGQQVDNPAVRVGPDATSLSLGGTNAAYVITSGGRQVQRIDQAISDTPKAPAPVDLREVGGPVSQFVVSRDGARAAAVSGDRLLIGIVRSSGQQGYLFDQVTQVAPSLTGVVAVAWADAAHVAVLARQGTDLVTSPWLVGVDGYDVENQGGGGLPQPVSAIAAAPDLPLIVEGPGSQLWQQATQGGNWTAVPLGPGTAACTHPEYSATSS
ncbi:MAG: LpqB family beta-propeller domain-containing protein [Mycobacteriales bacterium]